MALLPEPAISVLIVCWNSADNLPKCLRALAAQTLRNFEVIGADNGSSDGGTLALAEAYPSLQLLVEVLPSNLGFAAANNRGARLARGRWLALLNPDAFPSPDWLEQLASASRLFPRAFFASRQVQANRPSLLDGEGDAYFMSGLALRLNHNLPIYSPGPPREVFSACAAAAMYPLDEYLAAGGFDEDYFAYHEDVDLGFRLRLQGLHCLLVASAVVRHVGAASTAPRSAFGVYHGHRNLVWTFVKNMPAPWFWLCLPLHILMNLVSVIYFLFAGHGRTILRAKLDAWRGLPGALGKRRLVQRRRVAGSWQVIRHMDRNPIGPLASWLARQRSALD